MKIILFYHALTDLVITQSQMLLPTAELAIPTLTPTKKTNAEIETQPLAAETKAKKGLK